VAARERLPDGAHQPADRPLARTRPGHRAPQTR
jgi:hypothetical protein